MVQHLSPLTPRYATPDDDAELDRLLEDNRGHDVRLGVDTIIVTGEPPTGLLVYRPCAFVHELFSHNDLLRRKRAQALADFAIRDAATKGIHAAVFLVDAQNFQMIRFLESMGAVRQNDPGSLVYTWRRNG